jgi:hypothetical protein
MTSAKTLQLTNLTIGAVTTDSNIPLGTVTVVYPFNQDNCYPTYTVTSSTSDTLVVNKAGTYNIIYNASLTTGEVGNVVVELVVNGTTKYTASTSVTTSGNIVNITIPYEIYIPCNCASVPNNIPTYI